MPPVKALDRISAKWMRVSAVSQTEYEEGVKNPRTDWASATQAAASNYDAGVQKAIQNKSFSKGVAKAGTQKWQTNAVEKGPGRWAQGINLSANAYETGFQPYRDALERLQLPPRGPKGDPKNIQRVKAVADALHQEKLKRQGG
jgi:hypothetical protein